MSQIIVIAAIPLVSRLFPPDAFGVLSLYQSFIQFWLMVLTFRYEGSLLIAKSHDELSDLFWLTQTTNIVMALLAVPVLFILINTQTLGFEILPEWSPFIASMTLVGLGFFTIYRSWLLRINAFNAISKATVVRSVANVLAKITTGLANLGAAGLILSELVGAWFSIAPLRNKVNTLAKPKGLDQIKFKDVLDVCTRYKHFALFESPSMVINQLALLLPIPLIAATYGAGAAGIFGMARMIFGIPSRQIGNAVADVYQTKLSSFVRNHQFERGLKLLFKYSFLLALAGVVPFLAAVYLAPIAIPYLLGEEWRQVGVVVKIMAPWMYLALIVSAMSRTISVIEKQSWKLLYDVSALVAVLIVHFYAINNGSSFFIYIKYLSYTLAFTYCLYYSLIVTLLNKSNTHSG